MEPHEVFGRKCRDRINQYEGVCIGIQDWMFGCKHYLVKSFKAADDPYKGVHLVPAPVIEVLSDEVTSGLTTSFDYKTEENAFGRYYRDRITGYEGTCIGIVFTCYDEVQYHIQPQYSKKSKKAQKKPLHGCLFDKGRLVLVENVPRIDPAECDSGHKGGVDYIPTIY